MICGIALAATAALADDGPPESDGALEVAYEAFARSGVFDPDLSNQEANELVSQGLFSGNSRLVRLTVRAMAAHALSRTGAVVVERNFAAVPQLRDFLIAHWRAKAAEGLDPTFQPAVPRGEEEEAMMKEFTPMAVDAVAETADWLLVPRILASSFPGDKKVHDFLWYEFAPLVPTPGVLMVFNEGRFRTPEVAGLRVASVGAEDYLTSVLAAEGLAFSTPKGGLDALISALRHPDGRRGKFMMDAIVSYGPEAIPKLEAIPEAELPPSARQQVRDGLERLGKMASR